MCKFALIGAEAEAGPLLSLFNGPNNELDAVLEHDPGALALFPDAHAVVRVTLNGCSCTLLEGLGHHSAETLREAHVAGPGYVFRRSIAAATVAYDGVYLMVHESNFDPVPRRRVTTLGQFLRFGLGPDDGLISIQP